MYKAQPYQSKKNIIVLITYINIFICAVLFISMIIFASAYIIKSQYFMLNENDVLPVDTLLILKQGNPEITDNFNVSFIIPEFIGLRFNDKTIAITGNNDITKAFYLTISENIQYIFGSRYFYDKKEFQDGEAVWSDCLSADNYIYLKYPAEMPAGVINAFFNDEKIVTTAVLPENGIVFIKEMFLLFDYYGDETYGIHAVARDNIGNITVFEYNYINTEPRQYFKIEGILSYFGNNTFPEYKFAASLQPDSDLKLPLQSAGVIFDGDIPARDILVSNINDNSFSGISAEYILKQFGFNPDKLNSFINTEGTLVFIETHGELEILSDKIIYNASAVDGGLDISDYLSYGIYNGDYDIFEIIKATGVIIDSIRETDKGFLGGDAGLRVSDILFDSENNSLIINYKYYYDNIIIDSAEGDFYACRFTVHKNKITGIYMNSVQINGLSDFKTNYPQLWMLDKIGSLIKSTEPGEMRLAYLIQPGVEGTYSTKWIYTAEADSVFFNDTTGTDENETGNNNEMD